MKPVHEITSNLALLAQRAALLDSKWIPLADGLLMFEVREGWLLGNLNLSFEAENFTLEGRLRAHSICKAIQADGNS